MNVSAAARRGKLEVTDTLQTTISMVFSEDYRL